MGKAFRSEDRIFAEESLKGNGHLFFDEGVRCLERVSWPVAFKALYLCILFVFEPRVCTDAVDWSRISMIRLGIQLSESYVHVQRSQHALYPKPFQRR